MFLKPGFGRAAALAVLLSGVAPVALFAETPADTLVVADAIDDIVSIDPHSWTRPSPANWSPVWPKAGRSTMMA